jgi:hypothetical protein
MRWMDIRADKHSIYIFSLVTADTAVQWTSD